MLRLNELGASYFTVLIWENTEKKIVMTNNKLNVGRIQLVFNLILFEGFFFNQMATPTSATWAILTGQHESWGCERGIQDLIQNLLQYVTIYLRNVFTILYDHLSFIRWWCHLKCSGSRIKHFLLAFSSNNYRDHSRSLWSIRNMLPINSQIV